MNGVRRIGLICLFAMGTGSATRGQVLWQEDFETVPCGSVPAGWVSGCGNSDFGVDCTTSCEGGRSLRTFGLLASCWGAIVNSPIHPDGIYLDDFTVEFTVQNGTESLSGCHPNRASLAMYKRVCWGPGISRSLFHSAEDGSLHAADGAIIGSVSLGTCNVMRISYTRLDSATVRIQYWLDGTFLADMTLPSFSHENDLVFFHWEAGEGSAWFDDITLSSGSQSPCGDGTLDPGEECDDGNANDGDGCSSECMMEPGFICTGEPSVCGPDCNGNGIPDDKDIAECDGSPWCGDCNGSGVPDECEVPPLCPSCTDCNGDGVPDECEADSDGDGVIDVCDNCPTIPNTDQADADADEDGVGDACDACLGVHDARIDTGAEGTDEGSDNGEAEDGDQDDEGDSGHGEDGDRGHAEDHDDGQDQLANGDGHADGDGHGGSGDAEDDGDEEGDEHGNSDADSDGDGHKIKVEGSFQSVVPVDLEVDDVTYSIDDGNGHVFSFLVPAGSFEVSGDPDHGKFKYHAEPEGGVAIEAEFDFGKCAFEFEAKGVEGTELIVGPAVTFTLQVGPNIGVEVLTMEDNGDHLKYKARPKPACCDDGDGHDGDSDGDGHDDGDSDDDENGSGSEDDGADANGGKGENLSLGAESRDGAGGITCGVLSPAIMLLGLVGLNLMRPRRSCRPQRTR